jgi:hypothetical protein
MRGNGVDVNSLDGVKRSVVTCARWRKASTITRYFLKKEVHTQL